MNTKEKSLRHEEMGMEKVIDLSQDQHLILKENIFLWTELSDLDLLEAKISSLSVILRNHIE